MTQNKNYWRADAANRQLPYLNGIIFKTIVDDNARNQALQAGNVDMILQQDGPQYRRAQEDARHHVSSPTSTRRATRGSTS